MRIENFTLTLFGAILVLSGSLRAHDRLLVFTDDTGVAEKGGFGFDQTMAFGFSKDSGQFYDWCTSSTLEYGITNQLTAALVVDFAGFHQRNVKGLEDDEDADWAAVASEWKYLVLDQESSGFNFAPNLGFAYGKDDVYDLYLTLLFDKDFTERWTGLFNFTSGVNWDDSGDTLEKVLYFEAATGVSYKLNEYWAIGLETTVAWDYRDFESHQATAWHLGPAIHYDNLEYFFVTLSVMPQIWGEPNTISGRNLDMESSTRLRVGLIIGLIF